MRRVGRYARRVGLVVLVATGALLATFKGGYILLDVALARAYRRADRLLEQRTSTDESRRHDDGVAPV